MSVQSHEQSVKRHKKSVGALVTWVLVVILTTSCGVDLKAPGSPKTDSWNSAPEVSFSGVVVWKMDEQGERYAVADLFWVVEYSQKQELWPVMGLVGANGEAFIPIKHSTTFTLTAWNEYGGSSKEVSLVVSKTVLIEVK